MTPNRVQLRGIYTTALTAQYLESDWQVVNASPPIQDRFEASFSVAVPDVTIRETPGKEGIQLTGETEAVLAAVGALDAFGPHVWRWRGSLPRTGLFRGRVLETDEHGATVSVGRRREGFLPFGLANQYVQTGDRLLVQILEPEPPWSIDRRPVCSEWLTIPGSLLTLLEAPSDRGESVDDPTLFLDPDRADSLPDGWGLRFHRDAPSAVLGEAYDRALDRARSIMGAREEASRRGELGALSRPETTAWAWFDRTARERLDRKRRTRLATIPGHHRLKASGEPTARAVRFLETQDLVPDRFDIDAALEAFGPTEGQRVTIAHGKPDGRRYELGPGEVCEVGAGGELTVRRTFQGGGEYDGLAVPIEANDEALTRFVEGRWWYPTVYRDAEGNRKGTYVNVNTPIELFPQAVRYLDLHVDLIKYPDGRLEQVDLDELETAEREQQLPRPIANRAREVANALIDCL